MSSLFEDVVEEVKDFVSDVWELLCAAGNAIWDGLVWLADTICETIESFFNYIGSLFSKFTNWVGSFFVVVFELVSGKGKKKTNLPGIPTSVITRAMKAKIEDAVQNGKRHFGVTENGLVIIHGRTNNSGKIHSIDGCSGFNGNVGSEVEKLLKENEGVIVGGHA